MAVDSNPSDVKGTCDPSRVVQRDREDMNIVIVGHVDHGKSTIIGRLLADTGSLPVGKLEQVQEMCRRNSKPFEYAFLLDALKDERDQGITIDSARCFFKSATRNYIIIDAPGHIEFLKNMITGAARAEAALLVIDATEGIQENSKRHGTILSMLGIRQLCVLINKMDLVDYDEGVYRRLVEDYTAFLASLDLKASSFIPVSGRGGDNIATRSQGMPWYEGECVLEALDDFVNPPLPLEKAFRMPVQGIYRFTAGGDTRRIVAGSVETGELRVGDEVIFYPSGKRSRVNSIEAFNRPPQERVVAGAATGFTLHEQIYVRRGEIAARADEESPHSTSRLRVNLFWLGKEPMRRDKRYNIKLGTAKVEAYVEEIVRVIDASSLESAGAREHIERHDVAECTLRLTSAIAVDTVDHLPQTARFVIVDEYEIAGGGIVLEALADRQSWVRERVQLRNARWERSTITPEERERAYGHRSALILITGEKDVGKKPMAKALEHRLFGLGHHSYFLCIGNLLYGVDADIKATSANRRDEHVRRLAEVAHILLDAGAILIVTAIALTHDEVDVITTAINPNDVLTVWVGESGSSELQCGLTLPQGAPPETSAETILGALMERGITPRD